jgi:hypothetical protein
LSEYGVSDDDMPDCQPLDWGPEPYDDADLGVLLSGDEDLDALLSGATAGLPDTLRSLAETLTALGAGPGHRELDGEAAARRAFLLFGPAAAAGTNRDAARQPAGSATGAARQPAGPGPLVPRLVPDQSASARPPHRHRHRRRTPWPRRRAALVLLGGAAVVTGVVALAGVFADSGRPLGHPGPAGSTAPAAAAASTGARRPELEGGASAEPSPPPKAAASPQATALTGGETLALCRQYLESFGRPGGRQAESGIVGQLSSAAGGPWNVRAYCFAELAGASQDDQGPGPGSGGYPGEPGYWVNRGGPGRGGGFGGSQARTRAHFGPS